MIFKKWILALFLPIILFAEPVSSIRELASLQHEPSILIHGCVHAITGDFVFDQDDLVVNGAFPLSIPRRYAGRDSTSDEQLIPHAECIAFGPLGLTHLSEILLPEPNGMRLRYRPLRGKYFVPIGEIFHAGITGYCTDALGNRYHPSNNEVRQVNDSILEVTTSTGEKRIYYVIPNSHDTRTPIESVRYRLEQILLSNGILIEYHFQKNLLKRVEALSLSSRKILSKIKIEKKDHSLFAEASDRGFLIYEFKKYKEGKSEKRLLKRVKGNLYPEEELNRSHPSLQISARHFTNHRSVFCKYDERGRVTQLSGPQGILATIAYRDGETSSIDREGNKTLFVYDPNNLRLREVQYYQGLDTLLKIESYRWNLYGCLQQKKITTPLGKDLLTIDYQYNSHLDLIEKRIRGDLEYTYRYDYNEKNLLEEEQEDNGHRTTYTYYRSTSLPEEICTYKHDRLLKRTRYRYDDDLFLIEEIIDGEGPYAFVKKIEPRREKPFFGMPEWIAETCNDHLLQKTKLIYDKYGNVTKKQVFGTDGQLAYEIETSYNDKGQVLSEVDAEGNRTEYRYDENGNLTLKTTPLGLAIEYEYDMANRLCKKTEKSDTQVLVTQYGDFDALDHPRLEVDPYGHKIQRSYDALGNLIAETNSLGHTTEYEYDAMGNLLSVTDPLLRKTTTTYTQHGNPLVVTHPDGSIETYTYNPDGTKASYTNEVGITTQYTYDDFGNLSSEEIEGEISRSWTHDAFHLLEETNLDGFKTKYSYDRLGRKVEENYEGRVTTYEYDPLLRLKAKKTGTYRVEWTYDKLGRTTSEKEYDGDLLLFLTETSYNALGSPISSTHYPQNHPATSTYKYDHWNREILHVTPLGNKFFTSYAIQPGQEERTLQEPGGITETQKRNALGQLTVIERKNSENQPISRVEYIYDPGGNLNREETTIFENTSAKSKHTIEYAYDLRGRRERVIESGLRTTRFSYQPDGKLKTIFKPDGVQIHHTYNSLGHLTSICSSRGDLHYHYEYTHRGDLLLAKDLIHQTQTERVLDPHGQIIQETLANGLTLKSHFDMQGRRVSLSLPNGKTIQYAYQGPYLESVEGEGYSHSYSYDLAGNLLRETHLDKTITEYTYDLEGRIVERRSPHLAEIFAYDVRGNPIQITENGSKRLYTYDSMDHLVSEPNQTYCYDSIHNRTIKDGVSTTYNPLNQESHLKYDPNGNLLTKGNIHFEYDSLDRLIQIISPMGETQYVYDSEHRRVFEDERPILWDGQNEMGYVQYYRVLGRTPYAEIGSSVAIVSWDQVLQPLHNARGDLIQFLDPDIQMLPEQSFTAFGEGHTNTRWGYRSKIHEGSSGLIYFGRRYYDPDLGRFITSDPEGYTDSANLYAYALNNPLTNHDPYGLFVTWLLKNEPLGFDPNRWKEVGTALGHGTLAYARDTALAIGKFGGGIHGPDEMSFLELYQATNQARDRIYTASENWMKGSPYAGGDLYDWARGTAYTGMDIAAGWWMPFGKIKAAGAALKTASAAIKAEKTAHASTTLLKTRQVTGKIFKNNKQSLQYTKSNLQIGQQVHKSYKAEVADMGNMRKEFKLPSGRRIDFLDIKNGKVYELKPNNPRAIRSGMKQLNIYIEELKTIDRFNGKNWEGILEVY